MSVQNQEYGTAYCSCFHCVLSRLHTICTCYHCPSKRDPLREPQISSKHNFNKENVSYVIVKEEKGSESNAEDVDLGDYKITDSVKRRVGLSKKEEGEHADRYETSICSCYHCLLSRRYGFCSCHHCPSKTELVMPKLITKEEVSVTFVVDMEDEGSESYVESACNEKDRLSLG